MQEHDARGTDPRDPVTIDPNSETLAGIPPVPQPSPLAFDLVAAKIRSAVLGVTEVPTRIGRYRVTGVLGEGGMGIVVQGLDEDLDRPVAIKVLREDLSEGHAVRLRREAKALAKLSHPNVVSVYEVGTDGERTFIAMELVEGQTLTQWQQDSHPWREVVEVYAQAGRGLAAAHAKGLVHRDFKPSNCIRDAQGRVRVLDFGLVRAAGSEGDTPADGIRAMADAGLGADDLTRTGTVMGTLAYMAPEQLAGRPVEARADQFSFCVALHEALYGERPFEFSTVPELVVKLSEGRVPPAPRRTSIPSRLRRVVLRGLLPAPEDRWPSMDALLDALNRAARPQWPRWAVALGLAVVAAAGMVLGPTGTTPCRGGEDPFAGIWDDERRDRVEAALLGTGLSYAPDAWERVEARLDAYTEAWTAKHTDVCEATHHRREQSEEVMALRMRCLSGHRTATREAVELLAAANETVVAGAVDLVDGLPRLSRCDEIEALEADVPLPDDPLVATQVSELRDRLARARRLDEAGEHERAEGEAATVVEPAESLDYPPLLAEALLDRGRAREHRGRYAEAEQDLDRAYTLATAARYDAIEAEAATQLVWVIGVRQARVDEGRQWGKTALALTSRPGTPRGLRARAWHDVGILLRQQGELDQALEHLERARDEFERARGPEHGDVASTLGNIGTVLRAQGKVEEALEHQRLALEITERSLGPHHPRVAGALNNIGASLRSQGRLDEALQMLQRALEITEGALGPSHPNVAASLNNIGNVLYQQGDLDAALSNLERAAEIWEEVHGSDHPNVASALTNVGNVLEQQGELDRALEVLQRAVEILERLSGKDHPDVASALSSIGVVLQKQGKLDEALEHQQRALVIVETALGPDHPLTASSLNNLGEVRAAQGDLARALTNYRGAREILVKASGERDPNVAALTTNIGATLRRQGALAEARAELTTALRVFEATVGPEHPYVALARLELARVELDEPDATRAREHAERAVELRHAGPSAELAEAQLVLARALWMDPEQRSAALGMARDARDAAPEGPARDDIDAWLSEHR